VQRSRPANGAATRYIAGKMTDKRRKWTSEHHLQVAVVMWFRQAYPKRIILAIPNGDYRSWRAGSRLKAEGVLGGSPDLLVPEPVRQRHGLFLELKNGHNKPTDEQDALLLEFQARGYAAFWCNTYEDSVHLLQQYIEGKI
jgi:hypothetical protein